MAAKLTQIESQFCSTLLSLASEIQFSFILFIFAPFHLLLFFWPML